VADEKMLESYGMAYCLTCVCWTPEMMGVNGEGIWGANNEWAVMVALSYAFGQMPVWQPV
jgi:hypothetical protein